MEAVDPLNKFRKFIVENLRDKGINYTEMLLNGKWKAPSAQKIQAILVGLPEEHRQVIKQIVIESIDHSIHDFLFALQERADFENDIQVIVDGENVVELSDGIHGESFTEDGWNAKYSKYGFE